MSVGSVIGLLKSGTTISGGTLSAFEQRAYAIIGRSANGLSVNQQRAYALAGSINNGLAVRTSRAYAVVGIPNPNVVAVSQQRVHVIVFP